MNEATQGIGDAAQLLVNLQAAGIAERNIDGAHFLVLPHGYQHHDISRAVEAQQSEPDRKRGTVSVKDVASLLAYCQDQGAAKSAYIFADPDSRSIVAVFNENRDGPGWRDHRASYKAEYTPEFQRWLDNNGPSKAKGQTDFAEFIEDNLADIPAPFAEQLLNVATTIQATSGIEFKSAKRLDNGQNQLTYVETIDARAGAGGGLMIPREFKLGLRIFKNGGGYSLTARLKYRLLSGGVKFWYELDRPERQVEDAFAGYIEQVREKSGYAVLIGAAG